MVFGRVYRKSAYSRFKVDGNIPSLFSGFISYIKRVFLKTMITIPITKGNSFNFTSPIFKICSKANIIQLIVHPFFDQLRRLAIVYISSYWSLNFKSHWCSKAIILFEFNFSLVIRLSVMPRTRLWWFYSFVGIITLNLLCLFWIRTISIANKLWEPVFLAFFSGGLPAKESIYSWINRTLFGDFLGFIFFKE